MVRILFVCTGNVCRSPVAERLAKEYARLVSISDFQPESAGTHAMVGNPVDSEASRALELLGGDASGHVARQVSGKILMAADLILTMSTAHRTSVLELAPRQLNRTFTLHEASRLASGYGVRTLSDLADLRSQLIEHKPMDVADPFGRSPQLHLAIAREISGLLPPVLDLCREHSQS